MYKYLISQFRDFSVLVIGDLILDIYLQGASTRLTREGPVPIVDIQNRAVVLGGSANAATNVKKLGARVTFCSLTGKDENGDMAISLLKNLDINSLVLQDVNRTTIVKTRVVSGNQLLLRYDVGSEQCIPPELEESFIELLRQQYPKHDAIIITDYNKGLITPAVLDVLEALQNEERKLLAVDSKRLPYFRRLSPSLVKPNYEEVVHLLNLDIKRLNNLNRTQQINQLGTELFNRTGAAISAVTLDSEGATIFSGTELCYRCYGHQVAVPQVAGAGDTYISAFTLSLLAGAKISEAAEISAAAAAVAISKNITASCTYQELDAYLSTNEKYIADLEQLEHLVAMYRAQGKKVVFTNGCFDILHSGHVIYLNRARELGHVLIVGINTDESIKRLKGSNRPINGLNDRIAVLAGLGAVNHIVSFGREEDDTARSLIQLIRPDVFAKGADYTKESLPEAALLEQLGGEVTLLPLLPDRSTTLILDRIHNKYV